MSKENISQRTTAPLYTEELVRNIKPDENYRCNQCQFESYCKWCPERGWLEDRSFTICEPESLRWAENRM